MRVVHSRCGTYLKNENLFLLGSCSISISLTKCYETLVVRCIPVFYLFLEEPLNEPGSNMVERGQN